MRNNSLSYLNDFLRATLVLLSYNITLKSQVNFTPLFNIFCWPLSSLQIKTESYITHRTYAGLSLFPVLTSQPSAAVLYTLCSSLGSLTGPGTTNAFLPSILTLAVHLSLGYFFTDICVTGTDMSFRSFFFHIKN